MFETRGYRTSLGVSLLFSVLIHLVFLFLVRVEIGMEGRDTRSFTLQKVFDLLSGGGVPRRQGRPPAHREKMVVLRIREEEEPGRVARRVPEKVEEKGPPEPERMVEETRVGGKGTGPVFHRPFEPDSLDLLLTFPWMAPLGREPPAPRRMLGLERALRRLREEEIEKREADELAFDSKYGKFGVGPEGLLLGPIVIPLPLAPYTSGEAREEERAHREIQAQSLRRSMEDDDLRQQRERIIEWKKRRKGKDK